MLCDNGCTTWWSFLGFFSSQSQNWLSVGLAAGVGFLWIFCLHQRLFLFAGLSCRNLKTISNRTQNRGQWFSNELCFCLCIAVIKYCMAWHIEWADVALPISSGTKLMKSGISCDNIFLYLTDWQFLILFLFYVPPSTISCWSIVVYK